ncbi:MAG: hypothetical protein BWY74_03679 [Firmicutes bacterium ADurb.Bin419]|nr:MAG: hypothetical protein BWY74_03679 [Firmicutes bacterium ADurb.Bin419]
MKITGKLIKGTGIISEKLVEKENSSVSFRDLLEDNFIALCKELDISVPLWLKRNTTEFARYRRTSFTKDQFIEDVKFDRLEIRIG